MKKKLTIVLIAILVLLVFSSCMTTKENNDQCLITVTGEGQIIVDPDSVSFSIGINETAKSTGEAQKLANIKMTKAFEILDSYNIANEDIKTTNLSFSTSYDWVDGEQKYVGEQATQSIYVKMKDLENFDDLVTTIGQNLTGLSFNSVKFDKDDKTEAYKKARILAVEHAKQKAEVYASTSGLILGNPVQISEGSLYTNNYKSSPNVTMAFESADAGLNTQVPTGQIEITIKIDAIYKAY